jgi:hypothetical protein
MAHGLSTEVWSVRKMLETVTAKWALVLNHGESMIAFEILLNGKRLYTIGIGEFGVLNAHVMHHRVQTIHGPISEAVVVYGQGHATNETGDRRAVVWERVATKVGDEIAIRVIESDSCDPGKPLCATDA